MKGLRDIRSSCEAMMAIIGERLGLYRAPSKYTSLTSEERIKKSIPLEEIYKNDHLVKQS
jgi:hypothetical protein